MRNRAIGILRALSIVAMVVVAASVGSVLMVRNATGQKSSVTLTGVTNTLQEYVPMRCAHAPGQTISLCIPAWTNTISLGSNADPRNTFTYSFEVGNSSIPMNDNALPDRPIFVTSSNATTVVAFTLKVSTWNTSATIKLLGPVLVPNAFSVQHVTYFIPPFTITNATFLLHLNYTALKQVKPLPTHAAPLQLPLRLNVTNSLGTTRTMYGTTLDIAVN